MVLEVGAHPYGERAFEELVTRITAAQDDDRLRAVTVVVDRGAVGLAARRRLAAMPGGIVNVRHLTLEAFASDLAFDWVATSGRRPLSAAVQLEAVRVAFGALRGGLSGHLRDDPATARSIARTCRELADVPAGSLDALAGADERASAVVALVREIRTLLGGYYQSHELLEAAQTQVRRDPELARAAGTVIVYLPRTLRPAACELFGALGACTTVHVILGLTSDPVADEATWDLAVRLDPATRRSRPGPTVVGTMVRAAPNADSEVLAALRHLMRRHAEGVPLEQMALLHAGAAPYPRLINDTVRHAGIPFYGVGVRPLSATLCGRVLLGALALGDRDWRRDDVAAWWCSGPLLHRGRRVPAASWDALSCDAGIVGGLGDWSSRLAALATTSDAEETAAGARRARLCRELGAFVGALGRRLGEPVATWSEWSRWCERLLADLLGGPAHRAGWPDDEVAALDAVVEAIKGLVVLEEIGTRTVALSDLRAMLSAELELPAPGTARTGRGLLVGQVGDAVGLDFEVVCIVGMSDGAWPPPTSDDPLLPDRVRERGGSAVPLRRDRSGESRRAYLGAMAGARERVLSYPLGDQRRGRVLRPARAVLDTLGTLAGAPNRLYARDLDDPGLLSIARDSFEILASPAATVAGGGEPISPHDRDLRRLVRWVADGRPASTHPICGADPQLRQGFEARRSRRSGSFTRFDGRIDAMAIPSVVRGGVHSPTGLEAWARCPRRYFLQALLGVKVRERPEAVLRLHPLERGLLVHRVLERLVHDELADAASGMPLPPGSGREERVVALAAEEFSSLEREGLAGRPGLWRIDRSAIVGDLLQFVRDDSSYRAVTGATPIAVEEPFGWERKDEVAVALRGPRVRDGAVVAFHGTIDRVDRLGDGRLRVIDYKAGARPPADLEGDPVAGGTRLQLAIYALAARARWAPDAVDIDAVYWHVGRGGGGRGLTLSSSVEERLGEVLGTVVTGIGDGTFPANPGDRHDDGPRGAHCSTCPYDAMCPSDRLASWRHKRSDPWIEPYLALAEPS